jgi:hypothetical protein
MIAAIAFQLCLRILYEGGPRKPGAIVNEWDTSHSDLYYVKLLDENVNAAKKNTETLL